MEHTHQTPRIQEHPPRLMVPEAPKRSNPPVCVLGRQVPVRWLRSSSTVVRVQRLD
jgi:hypothetical protein